MLHKGECTDPACRYAHRVEELRSSQKMLKTQMCKYHAAGECVVGEACRFAHSVEELQPAFQIQEAAKVAAEASQAAAAATNLRPDGPASRAMWEQRRKRFSLGAAAQQEPAAAEGNSKVMNLASALRGPSLAVLPTQTKMQSNRRISNRALKHPQERELQQGRAGFLSQSFALEQRRAYAAYAASAASAKRGKLSSRSLSSRRVMVDSNSLSPNPEPRESAIQKLGSAIGRREVLRVCADADIGELLSDTKVHGSVPQDIDTQPRQSSTVYFVRAPHQSPKEGPVPLDINKKSLAEFELDPKSTTKENRQRTSTVSTIDSVDSRNLGHKVVSRNTFLSVVADDGLDEVELDVERPVMRRSSSF
jgi:hypothetical protein